MTAARRLAAILAADVVGYSRLMGEDEAGTARAVREHREAARPIVAGLGRPHRQDDGRRPAAGVSLRRRRRRMRDRDPEADGRAQRRYAGGQAHRLSHRRQSRRRADRGRRHSRRRRQYRGAAGGHLRAGRRADLGRGLRSRARQDRRGFRRSRREGPQEHRAAGAGLCGQDRLGKRCARALRLRAEQAGPAAPLDGRSAVRQYRRRPGAGAFRRRGHGEPHDRSFADTRRRS